MNATCGLNFSRKCVPLAMPVLVLAEGLQLA